MKSRSLWLRDRVWRRSGFAGWLGWLLLQPASLLFGVAVRLRGLGFRLGMLAVQRAAIPVVSVGNISVGGTGKTPMTLWLASQLQACGLRVGIVLRGYSGEARTGATVVSQGDGPLVGPSMAGDEAVMLAKRFAGVVIVAPQRMAGVTAAQELGCQVVVLDDGFQHRQLARDFDLVLIGGRSGSLLPAGPLRESHAALGRADALALVCKLDTDEAAVKAEVPPGKPSFLVRFHAQALVESDAGVWRELPCGTISGRPLAVVSGIAAPAAFYDTVRQWDGQIEEVFEYPDHHIYSEGDWQLLLRKTREAELIVTTEKDLVKLERFPFARGKLLAVRVSPQVERGDELVRLVLERTGLVDKLPPTGGANGD